MKENAEIKICKNKNCKKVLPEGYKYNRCEACRNQLAQNGKNILPVLLSLIHISEPTRP